MLFASQRSINAGVVDINQLRIGTSAPVVCLCTLLAVMGCAHTAQKGEFDRRRAQVENPTTFIYSVRAKEMAPSGSDDLTLEVKKTREEVSLAKYKAGEYDYSSLSWKPLTDDMIRVRLRGGIHHYFTDAKGQIDIDVADFGAENRGVQEITVELSGRQTDGFSLEVSLPRPDKRMEAKNASRDSKREDRTESQDRTERQDRRKPKNNASSTENRSRDNEGTATGEKARSREDAAPAEKIVSPVGRATVTSNFGAPRQGYKHEGVDFQASTGEKVRAWRTGTVIETGWKGGYGRIVKLRHLGPYSTFYAHLSKIEVREGEEVRTGETIGRAGATGNTTGSHLHFEIRKHDQAVDPAHYLSILR
jgi:murein DD-endopeptidase MepM/ murein hydrolase activator NlpD